MIEPDLDPKEHFRNPLLMAAWEEAHISGRAQVVILEDGARVITPSREGRKPRVDAVLTTPLSG
jgi:hypothetical protein